MLLLSYLGHGYVWAEEPPATTLPRSIAVPWHAVATHLGRPPVLSYASYALDNWRLLDPAGPIDLDNIAIQQNFFGGADEDWFIAIHVDIEAKAAALVAAVTPTLDAAQAGDGEGVASGLRNVLASLDAMIDSLKRMPEQCDPYIYYRRVRPYIHGWKNNPALPDGMVYEGVTAYGGAPQLFRGETGAQSSIVPLLDALLGVAHADDPLAEYLREMRTYMPPQHQRFIAAVESAAPVRAVVKAADSSALREVYNACVDQLAAFRTLHLEYAASYINKQAETSESNPVAVGTAGTPFMEYLKKHRDESAAHRIEG
jgi:indoleamine 2,3-dioxygenase